MGEDEVGAPESQEAESEGIDDGASYAGQCQKVCSKCSTPCIYGVGHVADQMPHRCYSGHEW